MKIIWFVIVGLVAVLFFGCQKELENVNKSPESPRDLTERLAANKQLSDEELGGEGNGPEVKIEKEIFLEKCNFRRKVELRALSGKNGVFPPEFSDIVVCGHLEIKREKVWGENTRIAYFKVLDMFYFTDGITIDQSKFDSFEKRLTVNFTLGCFDGARILNDGKIKRKISYLDKKTEGNILSSDEDNPVVLVLSFEKIDISAHEPVPGFEPPSGRACYCCDTANKIRVVEQHL